MAHQKHAKIKRPSIGQFHRNEWAILGAPCSRIETLVSELLPALQKQFRCGFVDADHHAKEAPEKSLDFGAWMAYTNKIEYHRWDFRNAMSAFEQKIQWRHLDLLLVNGNHFIAQQQILILDERKYDSLQRKKDRLSQVKLILRTPEVQALPDFLREHIEDHQNIPVLPIEDAEAIASFISDDPGSQAAPIKGLVLAGGKSQRMGIDKGSLVYHNGLPQRKWMYQLLEQHTEQTYLSCRPDQVSEFENDYQLLPDRLLGLGPFGAILSAFQLDPDAAWLVVACDLPFVDQDCIAHLLSHRDSSLSATAFHNPDSGFPEPLITLWEPRSYVDLLHFLSLGYSCPRKVLINTEVNEIEATNPDWIRNINTPEELEEVRALGR